MNFGTRMSFHTPIASAFGDVCFRHVSNDTGPHLHCAQRNTTNYNSMTIAALQWRHDDFGFGGRDLPGRPPGPGALRLPPLLRWSSCTTETATSGPSRWGASPSCRRSPCSCRSSTRCTSSSGCSTRWRGIRYPRDRFQIQVLDDSTDETQEICKRKVAELRAASPSSTSSTSTASTARGFKAGALENGLKTAKGEFVLIFDADFLPLPDILERTDPPLHRPRGRRGAVPLGAREPRLLAR